jgi:hypothetical protein
MENIGNGKEARRMKRQEMMKKMERGGIEDTSGRCHLS